MCVLEVSEYANVEGSHVIKAGCYWCCG